MEGGIRWRCGVYVAKISVLLCCHRAKATPASLQGTSWHQAAAPPSFHGHHSQQAISVNPGPPTPSLIRILIGEGKGRAVYDGAGPVRAYDGEWKNGLRHGQGKMTFKDEYVVEAKWFGGVPLVCAACGKEAPHNTEYSCPICHVARYCSQRCMEKDADAHKAECAYLADL